VKPVFLRLRFRGEGVVGGAGHQFLRGRVFVEKTAGAIWRRRKRVDEVDAHLE